VPDIRPFRALRFDPAVAGDLSRLVAPPYDVIRPTLHAALLARSPHNAVRLDLPAVVTGEDPDERYRRAAHTLGAWRGDGTLRKDPKPAVYVHEQVYRVPGTSIERTQRGFFARLRIDSFGPSSAVLPHERTMTGPKEERYRLLRATSLNTSPVISLFSDPTGAAASAMASIVAGPPASDVTDDDGVRHRLWVVPAGGDGTAEALMAAAGAAPAVIADGHHRYETAVRYRDERRVGHAADVDPGYDFVLMLFLDAGGELTVLPTHRLVRGAAAAGLARLHGGLEGLFDVEQSTPASLAARFGAAGGMSGGEGRFGLVTADGAWLLQAKRAAFAKLLPAGGEAVRALDVSLLGAALDALLGINAAAVAGGERINYTTSAEEAVAAVAAGGVIDAAFLLEPTPVASILAVAQAGDVMPQESTYFYPKALTGLLFNPQEQ
jgi:uncharacterized protein (DUF1015 family)